jgi:hypothetical protein
VRSALDWTRVTQKLGLSKGGRAIQGLFAEHSSSDANVRLLILAMLLRWQIDTISALQAFRKRNSDAKAASQAVKDMRSTVRLMSVHGQLVRC